MYIRKNFPLFFVFLILAAQPVMVTAQQSSNSESSSGSFYSLFGIGYPADNNTARELSMGISGVSLDESQSNGLHNPAIWGKNSYTTTSSGFRLSKYEASGTASGQSVNSLLEAGYLQVTLPLKRQKVGVSASLYPVTSSDFRLFKNSTITTPTGEEVEYSSNFAGSGGVNKLELGVGWNINKNISVGYAPSFAFITQENSREIIFGRSDFGSNSESRKITGSSFAQRFGALLNFRNLLRSKDRISIGASVNLPINISTNQEVTSDKEVNGQQLEVTLKDESFGEVTVPLEVNTGFTYYPSNLVNFSLEGGYQQWSQFESGFNSGAGQSFEMTDRYKYGLGAEYHPYKTNSNNFFSNFRYNAGVAYDTGHLKTATENINTLWFSAGLGIISPFSNSTIDLSAQYGLRGTTDNNLVREKIWVFNLSVNLTELMFFRPKLN